MNSAESSEPASICMTCESLEGAGTFSEEWVVGLYQYIFVSSFPKDAVSDVPDATSAKTLAEVLTIPFLPLIHPRAWKVDSPKFACGLLDKVAWVQGGLITFNTNLSRFSARSHTALLSYL